MNPPLTDLVLDTSVLVNFLAVDRADLLGAFPRHVLITNHVVDEVTTDYPEQLLRLTAATKASCIDIIEVTDLVELGTFVRLASPTPPMRKRLGDGECSAIAVAACRGLILGIEDRKAIKQCRLNFPSLALMTTRDLVLELVQQSALSVQYADELKRAWSSEHRFEMRDFGSFADLLPPPAPPIS